MTPEVMRDLESGNWATVNPYTCPCHGRGWMLSDFDTWHRCPIHGKDTVPVNEDDPRDNSSGHLHKVSMEAFETFYRRTVACEPRLFKSDFAPLCLKYMEKNSDEFSHSIHPYSDRDWVNAAEAVCARYEADASETCAQAEGFSCALEMNLAAEAAQERNGG